MLEFKRVKKLKKHYNFYTEKLYKKKYIYIIYKMAYGVYYIHPDTLSINIRCIYTNYENAVKNLKTDTENYMKVSKNIEENKYVNKKKDIYNMDDGYFLKMSNKYPNRINIYEKTSKDMGYVFSNMIPIIKKVLVFSLIEIYVTPDDIIPCTNETKYTLPKIELLFMDELKEKLKEKIGKLE